jgi:hypothetical protein
MKMETLKKSVNSQANMFLFVQPFIIVKRFLCFAEHTAKYNLTTKCQSSIEW